MIKKLLPTKINRSWKHYFYDSDLKLFSSNIIFQHTSAIRAAWSGHSSTVLSELSDPKFWKKLRYLCTDSSKIEELYALWKKRQPFAHISTQKILILLQEDIIPLLQCYRIMLREENKGEYPEWYQQNRKEILIKTQENIKRLKQLKQRLHEELLFRCAIYDQISASRHIDDVEYYFYQRINSLNLLNSPLIKEKTNASLSDDQRLLIFDLLKQAGFDEKELHQKVILPIPKLAYPTLRDRTQIIVGLNEINRFCQEMLTDLNLTSISDYLFNLRVKTSFIFKLNALSTLNKYFKKMKDKWQDGKLLPIFNELWKFRYILYFIFSLMAYNYLLGVISPILSFFVSYQSINAISNFLFYSVGLVPLWWLVWQGLYQFKSDIQGFLMQGKVAIILSSLKILEKSELLISNQLSQSIVDIANFDINHLICNIQTLKKNIRNAEDQLKKISFAEKLLSSSNLHSKIEQILNKLSIQNGRMDNLLKEMASHIVMRVEKDIQRLVESSNETQLKGMISPQQIEGLKTFVKEFGNPQCLQEFEEQTNMVRGFIRKIEKNKFSVAQKPEKQFQQSWGKNRAHYKLLKRWKILLNNFVSSASQKEACMNLIALLKGKVSLSIDELNDILNKIEPNKRKKDSLLNKIQWHLFNTLTARRLKNVMLLSNAQKRLIEKWYKANENEIEEAKKLFSEIISDQNKECVGKHLDKFDTTKMRQCFELLDGADIYAYLNVKPNGLTRRQNDVREFFEKYDGRDIRVYRLITLVPKKERERLIPKIAAKRLDWLLSHLEDISSSYSINMLDKELFHDYQLTVSNFSMPSFISEHKKFKETYQEKMVTFLQACQLAGFYKQNLLKQYVTKNQRITSSEVMSTRPNTTNQPARKLHL